MRSVVFLLLICGAALARAAQSDVAQAINALGASTFAARQAAITNLVALAGSNYEAVVRQAVQSYKQTDDPEVKAGLRASLQLIYEQSIYLAPRGFLGVSLNNVNNMGGRIVVNGVNMPGKGLWVNSVIPNSAAEKAGVLANDFIVAVDGREAARIDEFIDYVLSHPPGAHVVLDCVRGTGTNSFDVTLGILPDDVRAKKFPPEESPKYFKKWLREQGIGATSPAQ